MTKTILPILFFLTLVPLSKGQTGNSTFGRKNYIDKIKNAGQITRLLSRTDKRYKKFEPNEGLFFIVDKCRKISDSLHVQPWAKADFDNNGLTDLLVVGNLFDHAVLCILDKGGSYEIKSLTRRHFQDCTFPVLEGNKIRYYVEPVPEWGKRPKAPEMEQRVLVYRFGDFIEENPAPANHSIEKIEYTTSMCFGSCPVFGITIHPDRRASWNAEMYNKIKNKTLSGTFTAKITEDKYNDILNLLNYMDFENLRDSYSVNWTDDQSCTLKITYDNGKVKSISDYGLVGTFGLNRVYQLLFALRENQSWIK